MQSSLALVGKYLLFGFLVLLLLLPPLQTRLYFVKVAELGGYAQRAPHPELTWLGLTDNSYQPALEQYVEDRIGFREWAIRLRNQLAYSLFDVAHADDIIVGKDNILLWEGTIKNYLGEGFVGEQQVQNRVRRFKAVQDSLARRGKLLVFILAPGKASFYAEMHPTYYRNRPAGRSNYTAYAEALRRVGANVLDLNRAFRLWKDTASYPLFPRGGIHWSRYGARLAGDTLLRYLAARTPLQIAEPYVYRQEVTNIPRDTDNDIAKALNVIWEPAAFTMAYPEVRFKPLPVSSKRPNVLLIGDSFGYTLLNPYMEQAFSPESNFWYYGQQIAAGPAPNGVEVSKLDWRQEILKRDIILLLYTEHNLKVFDGNFSKNLYRMLTPLTPTDYARIDSIAQQIRQAPGAAERLWTKAHELNQSEPDIVRAEATEQYESMTP